MQPEEIHAATILKRMPFTDTPAGRDALLTVLPQGTRTALTRDQNNKGNDIDLIVDGLSRIGVMSNGQWPVIMVLKAAKAHVEEASELGVEVQSVVNALGERYAAWSRIDPPPWHLPRRMKVALFGGASMMVVAVLGLLAGLALSPPSRAMAVIILSLGTLGVGHTSVALATPRARSRAPTASPPTTPRYRLAVGFGALAFVSACWGTMALMASPERAARVLMAFGRERTAVEHLEHALASGELSFSGHLMLVAAQEDLGRADAATATRTAILTNPSFKDDIALLPGHERLGLLIHVPLDSIDLALVSPVDLLSLADMQSELGMSTDAVHTIDKLFSTPTLARAFDDLPRETKARAYTEAAMLHLPEEKLTLSSTEAIGSNYGRAADYFALSLAIKADGVDAVISHLFLGWISAYESSNSSANYMAEFDAARGILDADPSLEVVRPLYHYWRGRALYARDRNAEAMEAFEAGLALLAPDDSQRDSFYLRLAQTYISSEGSNAERVKGYLAQISDRGVRADALVALGTLYFGQSVSAQGTQAFAEIARATEATLTEALDLGADAPKVLLLLGSIAFMRKEYERALAYFVRRLDSTKDALSSYWVARSLIKLGRIAEAEPYAIRAASDDSVDDAHELLAKVMNGVEKWDRAIVAANKAIELDAESVDAHVVLAEALMMSTADESTPAAPRIESHEKALHALNRATDLLRGLGEPDGDTSRRLEAIRQIRQVLLNSLAYAYAESATSIDLGLRYAEEAIEIAPEDPYALDTIGWLEVLHCCAAPRSNRSSCVSARDHLQSALSLATANMVRERSETLYHLGVLALLEKDQRSAHRHFLESLEMNPTYAPPKRALEFGNMPPCSRLVSVVVE